jgi:hypothetical protein
MIRPRLATAPFLAVIGLGFAGPAAAHPHIFIKEHVEVLFDRNTVTGVRMTWSFDELYSSILARGLMRRFAGGETAAGERLERGLAIGGSVLVVGFAGMLMLGAWIRL